MTLQIQARAAARRELPLRPNYAAERGHVKPEHTERADLRSFARAFKRWIGVTPAVYAKHFIDRDQMKIALNDVK